jgi:hypothetical protein
MLSASAAMRASWVFSFVKMPKRDEGCGAAAARGNADRLG